MPKVLHNVWTSFALENNFVHHGQYFQKLIKEYAPNRAKLSRALGYKSRNSLYNLYDDEFISWEKWYIIARILKVDVWNELPEMPVPKNVLREDPEFYGTLSLAECLREKGKLQSKVNDLQDKLNLSQQEVIRLQKELIAFSIKKVVKNADLRPK